jgi:hypothetical protein
VSQPEIFKYKVIKSFSSREDAILFEIKLHKRFNVSSEDKFYNKAIQLTSGFSNYGNKEIGDKISDKAIGRFKGQTYEEIYGENKATELRKLRSENMKSHLKQNPGIRDGEKNPNYGKKWNDEKRKKMSKRQQGENHTQYGYFWVTDGKINKKLPPNSEIPNGFTKGRTWPITQCPHCGYEGRGPNMKRIHFDRCEDKNK